MPIEIRELVIKATVVQDTAPGAGQGSGGSANDVSPNEEIINTCLDKLNQIQKDKKER